MSELAAFLLAQIAADEATARAATDGGFGWRLTDRAGANEVWADRDAAGHDAFMVATTATRLNPNPGERGYSDAAHIARHDPARVLAECEAKREIVERYRIPVGDDLATDEDTPTPEWLLRLLALPYSDHDDYRDEWRP